MNPPFLSGWVFLKASGMTRVKRFDDYESAFRYVLRYVVGRKAKYPVKTLLVGAGLPPTNSKGHTDYYSRMTAMEAREAAIWLAEGAEWQKSCR